jgi:hypothetical protein
MIAGWQGQSESPEPKVPNVADTTRLTVNPGDVAPMVVFLAALVVGGGVALLRPITKRLGAYIEAVTLEKRRPPERSVEPRVIESLERIEERLHLLEERQDFTDSLLARGTRPAPLKIADSPPAD